jgi:hypothetical protein
VAVMANIEKRVSQAGLISYRVLIRLKGYPGYDNDSFIFGP